MSAFIQEWKNQAWKRLDTESVCCSERLRSTAPEDPTDELQVCVFACPLSVEMEMGVLMQEHMRYEATATSSREAS